MRVDVEDIYALQDERARYNRLDLKDIEFYHDGELVTIPEEVLEEWRFTGLSNICFVMNYEWPEKE